MQVLMPIHTFVMLSKLYTRPYPPAMEPTTRRGSSPYTTSMGSRLDGGSCDKSSPQAKKRMNARRCFVTWSPSVPRSIGQLDILTETPGVTVYGIKDTKRLEERVPTCAFTLLGKPPRQVAEELDEAKIFVWDGNYYALEVTERLGLEDSGGMVRVGPVHYNTLEEIEKFGEVMGRIAGKVT